MSRLLVGSRDGEAVSDLTITLSVKSDGSVTVQCKRADGSATWQRHQGPRARYFPFHDLSHYAVETTLGARDGFYGLIAAGWDIVDTSGKGARGPVPAEALLVEQLVGLFDRERVGGAPPMTAEEMHAHLDSLGVSSQFREVSPLTEETLNAVRAARERLFDAWGVTQPERPFELTFDRPAISRLSSGPTEPLQRR